MKITKTTFILIILSLVIIFAYFFVIKGFVKNNSQNSASPQTNTSSMALLSQINSEAGVSIEVRPVDFQFGKQVKFEISFNTHQGDLDFDLTKISILTDDQERQYLPLEWQGGQGGHHLSGTLIFPPLKEKIKQFKLIIKNVFEISERIFEWNLE